MGDALHTLDADVLFVGGGPANLAGALRLSQLVSEYNARVAAGELTGSRLEPQVVVLDKGRDVGAHAISAALFDPIALQELLPDYRDRGFPFSVPVARHGL